MWYFCHHSLFSLLLVQTMFKLGQFKPGLACLFFVLLALRYIAPDPSLPMFLFKYGASHRAASTSTYGCGCCHQPRWRPLTPM